MTPIEQARRVYEREWCARTFRRDLELHLQKGFVFSTPEFFAMGRPVARGAAAPAIVDPSVGFPRENCDCWMVYLAAGRIGKIWSILPWPLPWICWERKNELQFYESDRIRRISDPRLHENVEMYGVS